MPRLFTGIEIPEPIRLELMRLQSGLENASWIAPENFHITLRFIGDIDEDQADEFLGFLQMIDWPPFEIKLGEIGSFGGRKPRAVWIGVAPSTALAGLHHAHEMAAQKSGLKPETRNFTPHITLARLRHTTPEATARYIEQHSAMAPARSRNQPLTFTVERDFGGTPIELDIEAKIEGDNMKGALWLDGNEYATGRTVNPEVSHARSFDDRARLFLLAEHHFSVRQGKPGRLLEDSLRGRELPRTAPG